jgi:3-hydroxybutyryl-CoA dehydrogenase
MSIAHGIKTLGVIGAGQMGLGIAYVAALRAKLPVQLYDRSSEQISKGLNLMDRLLAKDVSKGKIQEADARHARERVSVIDHAVGVRGLRDVDMVIEAVSENLEIKRRIFEELTAETRPDTILDTNTSSISITQIAASAVPQGESAASAVGKRSAARVVGLHFFNPVPVMVSLSTGPTGQRRTECTPAEIGRADLCVANVRGYVITCSGVCSCM